MRSWPSVTPTVVPGRTMALEEHIVLPAAHSQQDASNDGEVVRIFRVDGDLSRRPARQLVD